MPRLAAWADALGFAAVLLAARGPAPVAAALKLDLEQELSQPK